MRRKKSIIQPWQPALIFAALLVAALCLRIAEARQTSFWCDEIAWIRDSYSFSKFFHHIRSTGPLGPLDPLGIVYMGKALGRLGVHPHVAYRAFTIALSLATALLGFLFAGRRSPVAWLWFVWALSHTTIHAMALNARPYMSPIFFGALGLWIAATLDESKPRLLWGAVLVLAVLGSLSQPYVDFTHVALGAALLVSWRVRGRRSLKIRLLAVTLAGIALTVFWLTAVRHTLTITETESWSFLFMALKAEPWRRWFVGNLHAFAGEGVSLLFFIPLWIIGLLKILREKKHGLWAYGIVMVLLAFSVPPVLALKHGYFFVPRQAFTALPVLGYVAVQGMLFFFQNKKPWAAVAAAAFAMATVWSNGHWLSDLPPYADMPRYRLETTVPELAGPEGRPVVVLSQCHWGVATLYSSPENFYRFFTELWAGRPYAFEDHGKGVHLWTTDVQSCFGVLRPHADDNALDQALRRNPDAYGVLAFQGLRVPSWMPQRCRYEYGAPCMREE